MLPKNLLLVKRRKGQINPKYLNDATIAKKVLNTFNEALGKKYKDLKKELKTLETGRNDYKKIRALSKILERNCVFTSPTNLESSSVRSYLFEHGFVVNNKEREKILNKASEHFEVSKKEIERTMFGDLPQEQILTVLSLNDPHELTAQYNLSQIQTLLFNALELSISLDDNFQHIFRKINYLGLMYKVFDKIIIINGPASLFKKTRKYGTEMAKIIPLIISSDNWTIEAKIEMKWRRNSRIYHFKLDSSDNILLPEIEPHIKPFDSEVEASFYHDFKLFAPDWEIKREPTFLKAGNYVTIPDFGFYKWDIKFYLEVVGFWTPEYLEKKIIKLNNVDTEILVAVNEKLRCTKDDFPGEVIFYKNNIPIKPILKILHKKEEEYISQRIKDLNKISIDEDIISIEKKAREIGVPPDILAKKKFSEHFIVGDKIISQKFLNNLKKEIGKRRNYSCIKKILEKYELTNKVLEYLGFKVLWSGLFPEKVVPVNQERNYELESF